MNKLFEKPEVTVIVFTGEDVITTSNSGSGNTGSFDGEWVPIPW